MEIISQIIFQGSGNFTQANGYSNGRRLFVRNNDLASQRQKDHNLRKMCSRNAQVHGMHKNSFLPHQKILFN